MQVAGEATTNFEGQLATFSRTRFGIAIGFGKILERFAMIQQVIGNAQDFDLLVVACASCGSSGSSAR